MSSGCRIGRAFSPFTAALLASAMLPGCGGKPVLEVPGGPVPARPTSEPAPPVELTPVDRAAYDAAIARHRGRVVLVDFWATWCLPCVEQLPHTLELGRRFRDRRLAVVTVSCDEPAEIEKVAQFLASKQAHAATNLISKFGGSPQTMEAFELSSGAVPFYKLYDRTGKLRQTFGIDPASKKQFTPADIEAATQQLLAE
jgi:thiol-disulfide isomerase/thioredoxin